MIANFSLRTDVRNQNHHLWLNNGTWFIHYTAYPTPVTKERIRRSLNTKSIEVARQRRDELFRLLAGGDGVVGMRKPLGEVNRMTTYPRRFEFRSLTQAPSASLGQKRNRSGLAPGVQPLCDRFHTSGPGRNRSVFA